MIPKIIHYCWFGGAPKSAFIKKCMQTWKEKMPDYTWKEWNENTFDIGNSIPFVKEAYKAGKWAFVADYVRLYALYTEGGIYMDTDVKVLKPFDDFLTYNFFSAHEKHPFFYNPQNLSLLNEDFTLKNPNKMVEGWAILSAIMGSVPKLPYIKECMEHYDNLQFDVTANINDYVIGKHITIPLLHYGYRFFDEKQVLKNNMLILPSTLLVGNLMYKDKNPYAIHLCNGSWHQNTFDRRFRNNFPRIYGVWSFINRIYNGIKRRIK